MKNQIFTLLLLLVTSAAGATHIVGGTISYKSLGGGDYLVSVEVYRDCYNGIPWFDNPLSLAVYDENNILFTSFSIPLDTSSVDTVSILPGNFVCIFPEGVCIEKAVYSHILTLPQNSGKYTVVSQRCCLSEIVSNLVNPLDRGITLFAVIDDSITNSSPVFNKDVPVAIFSNVPFIYDGGAMDEDGDSLVYNLTTPIIGAIPSNPMPVIPSPPPYEAALFLGPLYSLDNMLGGNYPLVINPVSGEFSAIPAINGGFQIAYKVEEYRNGQLIGVTNKQFLFYVIPPEPTLSYDVSGGVFVDSFTVLDAGVVEVFERDVTNDSLYHYETYQVANNGEYAFQDIPPGVFYLRASPDATSAYFDNYLPTYFRSNLFWYDATTINQCDTSQFYRDIYLIHADSFLSGGPVYQLKGTVRNASDGEVVQGLDLFLADEFRVYRHTKTDDFGRFVFTAVPGDYQIYVDLINSGVLNEFPPTVSLAPGQEHFLKMVLHPDRLEFDGITNNKERSTDGRLEIRPNPSSGQTIVHIPHAGMDGGTLQVFNANGKSVQVFPTATMSYIPLELETGFYFLHYSSKQGIWTGKMSVVR